MEQPQQEQTPDMQQPAAGQPLQEQQPVQEPDQPDQQPPPEMPPEEPAPKKRLSLVWIVVIVIVIPVVFFGVLGTLRIKQVGEPIETPSPSPSPITPSSLFENEFMEVTVPEGWVAAGVGNAVNITKGNYILFVNPFFEHASGIVGGRFSEVAGDAPSVDLVTGKVPGPQGGFECATVESRTVNQFPFNDYYTDASKGEPCLLPAGQDAWFLSASSGPISAYFPGFPPAREYAITMAYQTNNVNVLPRRGNTELVRMLDEMDAIVTTIVFK